MAPLYYLCNKALLVFLLESGMTTSYIILKMGDSNEKENGKKANVNIFFDCVFINIYIKYGQGV